MLNLLSGPVQGAKHGSREITTRTPLSQVNAAKPSSQNDAVHRAGDDILGSLVSQLQQSLPPICQAPQPKASWVLVMRPPLKPEDHR